MLRHRLEGRIGWRRDRRSNRVIDIVGKRVMRKEWIYGKVNLNVKGGEDCVTNLRTIDLDIIKWQCFIGGFDGHNPVEA